MCAWRYNKHQNTQHTPLCRGTRVTVISPKSHSAQLTPRDMAGNYRTIFLDNEYFPLRYLPFSHARFLVLNPNMANYSLFLHRGGAWEPSESGFSLRNPVRQVSDKAYHETVISGGCAEVLALGARASRCLVRKAYCGKCKS